MSEFVLRRADVRVLLSHLALYGLGAILEDAGVPDIGLAWTAGMTPRGMVCGSEVTSETVDALVREHAGRHAVEPSWVLRDVELKGSARALMSPRLTPFEEPKIWGHVQNARRAELHRLTESKNWLDLRFLAALGEPCYWSRNDKDRTLQDDGASRLEMQPRNQGSEFVGTRLRALAKNVSARVPGAVASGIEGLTTTDEAASNKARSLTATGLANPGPTDNALVWCALFGISQLPTAPRINSAASTSGHIGRRREWFYVPVWEARWRSARLRSVLASRQLKEMAGVGLPNPWGTEPARAVGAREWLAARGVVGVVRFTIERFGSDSAPERRAMLGVTLPIGTS